MDVIKRIAKLIDQRKCPNSYAYSVRSALNLWARREHDPQGCYTYRIEALRNEEALAESLLEERGNVFTCFGMAITALELQNYERAESLFQQLPERYQLPGYQQICRFHRRFPVGNTTYAALAPQLWEDFRKRGNTIAHALETGANPWAMELICNIFHAQTVPFPFAIAQRGDSYQLQFRLRDAIENIFPLLYLEEHFPADRIKRWQARAGMEPTLNESVFLSGSLYGLNAFQYHLDDRGNNGKKRIQIYNTALAKLAAKDSAEAQKVAEDALFYAAGELAARSLFDPIVVAKRSLGRDAATLDRFPLEMLLEVRMSAREYLDIHAQEASHLKPSAGLRSDILTSTSCFPELLQEYRERQSHIFHNLLSQGVAAGFVFFPSELCLRRKTFHTEIAQQIENAAGDDITVTGSAFGNKFCYIDFVAYDFLKVLGVLKQVFAGIQGGEAARFASFYPGAKPTSLDADKEIAAYRAAIAQIQGQA